MRKFVLAAAGCLMVVGIAACGGLPNNAKASSGASLTTSDGTTIGSRSALAGTTVLPFRPTGAPTFVPPVAVAPPANGRVAVPKSQITAKGMSTPPVSVMANGVDVSFVAGQSGCEKVTAAATSQTTTSVTITVTTTSSAGGTHVCPMYVVERPLVVVLAKPLGNRQLIFVGVTKHVVG